MRDQECIYCNEDPAKDVDPFQTRAIVHTPILKFMFNSCRHRVIEGSFTEAFEDRDREQDKNEC